METHRSERSSDDDRGAITVEFALILPILIVLLVGIVNFGFAFNAQIVVQGAAREGARALALGNDPVAAAQNSTGVAITVIPGPACPDGNSDAFAQVTTQRDVEFQIPFFSIGTKTLTATARMRCGL